MTPTYKKHGKCTATFSDVHKCSGFDQGAYGMICGNIFSIDDNHCMFVENKKHERNQLSEYTQVIMDDQLKPSCEKKSDAEKLRILSDWILRYDYECLSCVHRDLHPYEYPCNRCSSENNKYEPIEAIKIAREIVK